MPKVSVFTPSHKPIFLDTCQKSLMAQTFKDWEWVVALNGGAKWTPARDERVKVYRVPDEAGTGVGAMKAYAAGACTGDVLLELDHDDELASTALARTWKAFADHPEVGLVFSDCAQINADGTMNEDRFDERHGWQYKRVTVDGRQVLRVQALEATPHNVSYIWYAPNHLRAFRRTVYEEAGGYDPAREVLDDQDLMGRMYRLAPFHHLHSTLYLQRIHNLQHGATNTQSGAEVNKRIQEETVVLYDQTIQANALAWAGREGLHAVDLGSAHNRPDGYDFGVDREHGEGADLICDVEKEGLPFDDNDVGVLRASDFLEHLRDPIGFLNEAYRVLAPGGMLLTLTPSTDGRGAFQDPTHVSFWNSNSWWYYTQEEKARYLPAYKGRFQVSRIFNTYPDAWHEFHRIVYTCANLVAVKDGAPRQGGFLLI